MIHVGQLSAFVKKVFNDRAHQTSLDKIISQIHIDPETSGMDLAVISPKDLRIVKIKNNFIEAMKVKHPDIDVLYIYSKKSEVAGLEDCGMILKEIKRPNLSSIEEAVKEVLENREIIKKDVVVVSQDGITPEPIEEPEPEPTITKKAKAIVGKDRGEIQKAEEDKPEELNLPEEKLEEVVVTDVPEPKPPTIEERVKACGEFADWNLFKQLMKKDAVVRELISENNKFYGTVNMMTNLDKKIATVFKDTSKTAEERFDAIRDYALQRTGYREEQNNMITEKVMSIMSAIVASAEQTIERRVDELTKAVHSFSEQNAVYYKKDREVLSALIEERLDIQITLNETIKEIIDLYKSMDSTVAQVIEEFDKDLPSENHYINEMYKFAQPMFTPDNIATLSSKLMRDLQQNRVSFSLLENQLKELITLVFKCCDIDGVIIDQQNKLIELLKANNVEDVVVVDTLLKNCLRLYIGPNESGTRSTTITWAGILSRRHNTLLIDLTGNSKFREYGIEPVALHDFLAERIQKDFLCVEGDIRGDMEYLQEVIGIVKTRLDYYPYVNIILNTDQAELIRELSENALSATFITDCTNRSNTLVRDAIQELKLDNIARKIVMIAPLKDPLPMLNDITGDPLTTKVISIPHLNVMKSCSYKAMQPFKDKSIVEIFEEAFR